MRGYQKLSRDSRIVDFLCYLIHQRIIEISQDSVYIVAGGGKRFLNGLDCFHSAYALLEAVDKELRIAHEEFDHYIGDCKEEIIKLKNLFNRLGETKNE